jgi:small subunit ribosomal protein S21
MPKVRVYDNNIEKALRKFKKAVANEKVLEEVRAREAYEKPSLKRKRKLGAAKSRLRKKLSKERISHPRAHRPKS